MKLTAVGRSVLEESTNCSMEVAKCASLDLARLFAACPDLLEAAKLAMVELTLTATCGPTDMTMVITEQLCNAIAKAELPE